METNNHTPSLLDADYWQQLMACGSIPFDKLWASPRHYQQEYRRFKAQTTYNPKFQYPLLIEKELRFIEKKLLLFLDTIPVDPASTITPTTTPHDVIAWLYARKAQEHINKIRLLITTVTGNMADFKKYTSAIYGQPTPALFYYTLRQIQKRIETSLESDNPPFQRSAAALAEHLPPPTSPSELRFPSDEVIAQARSIAAQEFSQLLDQAPPDTLLNAEKLRNFFTQCLQKTTSENWKTVLDENFPNISISTQKRLIRIPPNRRVTAKKALALALHEVGTHVARRINGEQSSLRLLSLGLDNYLTSEEGIATMREQTILKNTDFRGESHYLAIGLVWEANRQPRDFRTVYTIMKTYFIWHLTQRNYQPKLSEKTAEELAWKTCLRIFRGTNGQTPGACLTKEIIYRQGNSAIWQLIEHNPSAALTFNLGKYDPTNPNHLLALKILGILKQ